MEVIHSTKSDSPGYTRYFFDEPIGSGQAGVVLKGSKMKLHTPQQVYENNQLVSQDESEFQITLHGQQFVDLPTEVKELKLEDGSTLKLSRN